MTHSNGKSTCSCFADECPNYPLQLVLLGIVNPLINFVLLTMEIGNLRLLVKTMKKLTENCTGEQFQNFEPTTRRCFNAVRNVLRMLIVYSITKLFDFARSESQILRYRNDIGFCVCYLMLFLYYIGRCVIITITIFSSFTIAEFLIITYFLDKPKEPKVMETLVPKFRFTGTPFMTGAICIAATALTLFNAANFGCFMCDAENKIMEIERIRLESIKEDTREAFRFMDVLFLLLNSTLTAILLLLACSILFISFNVTRFYIGSGLAVKKAQLNCLIIWSTLSAIVLSVHYLNHYIADLVDRLTNINDDTKYNDCNYGTFQNKGCLFDDFLYYFEQICIAIALRNLNLFLILLDSKS